MRQGCFDGAIARYGYGACYRGVFPVKCNHDRGLVAAVLAAGAGWGLEVGSKPELLLAMSALAGRPGALLICNGYKDAEYVELVRLFSFSQVLCGLPFDCRVLLLLCCKTPVMQSGLSACCLL
jgi:arginine decarboxylase-like protein